MIRRREDQPFLAGAAGDPVPAGRDDASVLRDGLPARVITEASNLDSVEAEVALLRLWLFETTAESTGDRPLMLKLSRQVVEAAAVKYRLSPKRTDDLATAVSAVLERLGEQLTAPQEREV